MRSRNSTVSLLLLISSWHWRWTEASSTLLSIPDFLRASKQPLPFSSHYGNSPINTTGWSYHPFCIDATRGPKKKYCIYTNKRTGPNGISIITTPEVAEKAVNFVEEDPLTHYLTPEHVEQWPQTPRAYTVTDVPGKDKGVVATRLISQFETIMIDRASIVVDVKISEVVKHAQNVRLLQQAVKQLADPGLVRNLSRKATDASGHSVEEDVMATNSFAMDLTGVSHMALFPEISRINHECRPNAFVMFSPTGISMAIKAFRAIQPGEEITISYVLLGLATPERHAGLKRWGFTCTCAFCRSPPSILAASDSRRYRIEAAKRESLDAWRAGRFQAAIRLGEEVLDLLKEENLRPMFTEQAVILARLHLALQEREKAEEYGELALEVLREHGILGSGEEEWNLDSLLASFND